MADQDQNDIPECRGTIRSVIRHLEIDHDEGDVLTALFSELYTYGLSLTNYDVTETNKLMRGGMKMMRRSSTALMQSEIGGSLH
jgi:hypothetical protein